ncbi:MAG: Vgb family protein [Acidimicrobiales bacterium]
MLALSLAACSQAPARSAASSALAPSAPVKVHTQPWPGRPSALAYGFGHLWVADDSANTVVRVDPVTGNPDGNPIAVGAGPVAVAAGAGAIWVICSATSTLYRIDPRSQTVAAGPIAVAQDPVSVVAGNNVVWVASLAGASLTRVDASSNQADALVPYPVGPVRLALSTTTLWVTGSDGTLSRLDPTNGQAEGTTISLGGSSFGVAVDARSAWVSDFLANRVHRVSVATGAAIGAPIPVGTHPGAMADGDGSVWVTNHDDSSLTRINTTTAAVWGSAIGLGGTPRDITVEPSGRVFVVTVRPSALVSVMP